MKKGFTLIELLAVIVILAIIALIATPIILGIINDAREDSNKRSVENYAHAVELAVARYAAGHDGVIHDGLYTIDPDNKQIIYDQDSSIKIPVDYKGEKIEGKVDVDAEGRIELSSVSLNGGNKKYTYTENAGVEEEIVIVESPFKVTDDGILLHYERQGNETSVVVPKEVNGIKIKSIVQYAFAKGDFFTVGNKIIILNEEYEEEIRQLAVDFEIDTVVKVSEFGKGNDPFEVDLNYTWKRIIDMSSGEIDFPETDNYLAAQYMKNVDLSQMKYLETLGDYALGGYNGYGNEECGFYGECILGTLESVTLPQDGVLKTIGYGTFGENQLTSIIIPPTVTSIGNNAFRYNNFTEIIIPSSVESIGEYAFERNDNLTKITIERANSDGITFGRNWNGTAEVIYDAN